MAAKADETEVSGITIGSGDARDRRASSTRTREPQGLRPGDPADRGRVQGGRRQGLPQAAHRREDADRRRSVREAERREAGVPDSGVPGVDVQQGHVRSARQGGLEVRARQGRRRRSRPPAARRSSSRRTARDWKITKPLADARRLRIGRRADRPRADGADEVDRRRTSATPADLKKYGLDKPEATVNLNAGSARATLLVGGKATTTRSTRATRRSRRSSRSKARCSTI